MELLEAGHDAEVDLALWTVVLRLPPQYPAVGVYGVPTVIAAERGARSQHGTVAEALIPGGVSSLSARRLWRRRAASELGGLYPQSRGGSSSLGGRSNGVVADFHFRFNNRRWLDDDRGAGGSSRQLGVGVLPVDPVVPAGGLLLTRQ